MKKQRRLTNGLFVTDARFFLNKMRVAWHVDPAESFGDGMEIEEISIPTWATIGRLDM